MIRLFGGNESDLRHRRNQERSTEAYDTDTERPSELDTDAGALLDGNAACRAAKRHPDTCLKSLAHTD